MPRSPGTTWPLGDPGFCDTATALTISPLENQLQKFHEEGRGSEERGKIMSGAVAWSVSFISPLLLGLVSLTGASAPPKAGTCLSPSPLYSQRLLQWLLHSRHLTVV